jgi:PAS domain S-box-containing protein
MTLEASVTAAGFEAKSEKMLLPHLKRLQIVTGAVYAMALDPRGLVLAHTEVSQKGRRYNDVFTGRVLQARGPISMMNLQNENPLLELAVPVWTVSGADTGEYFHVGSGAAREGASEGPPVGVIRLGLPLQESLNTQSSIIRQLILIRLIISFGGVLAAWFLIRGVLWPVERLLWATKKISEGSYGTEIPVVSKDELGNLARSFNRMSKILAETTVSKNFLGNILSNMGDALMVLAPDGSIRMVNQTALKLLGYQETELLGRQAVSVFLDQHPALGNVAHNVELDLRSKDGMRIPVLFSSAVLKEESGQVTGTIITAKDMTERRRLESAMRQSEKMSAVGRLAAGIAHEINTPLGVILGFAEEVVSGLAAKDPLELPLKSIEREAVRCKNLVDGLLVFSRVSKTESASFDINLAVESACSLVIPKARLANIEVRKELCPDLPSIAGSMNQIQQVIINLANNALDAMEGKRGLLTIRTEKIQDGPLWWACVRIIDSGPGISAEIMSQIFEPFFTTKKVGRGTGLGLSLVHEIVKKHSGTIDVESRPGHTEFCVKFPLKPPKIDLEVRS